MDKRTFNPNSLKYGDIVQDKVNGRTGKVLKTVETLGVISVIVYWFFDKSTVEVANNTINLVQQAGNNIFTYVSEKANLIHSWDSWNKSQKRGKPFNALGQSLNSTLPQSHSFSQWLQNDPRTKQYKPKVSTPQNSSTPTFKVGNKSYFGDFTPPRGSQPDRGFRYTKNSKGEIVLIDLYNTYPLNYGQTGYNVFYTNSKEFLAQREQREKFGYILPPSNPFRVGYSEHLSPLKRFTKEFTFKSVKSNTTLYPQYAITHSFISQDSVPINDILFHTWENRWDGTKTNFFDKVLPGIYTAGQHRDFNGNPVFDINTFFEDFTHSLSENPFIPKKFLKRKTKNLEDFIGIIGKDNIFSFLTSYNTPKTSPEIKEDIYSYFKRRFGTRFIESFASRFPYSDSLQKDEGYRIFGSILGILGDHSWNFNLPLEPQLNQLIEEFNKPPSLSKVAILLGKVEFQNLLKNTPGASEYIWNKLTEQQKKQLIKSYNFRGATESKETVEEVLKVFKGQSTSIDYRLLKKPSKTPLKSFRRILYREKGWVELSGNYQYTYNKKKGIHKVLETGFFEKVLSRHIYKYSERRLYNPVSGQRGIIPNPYIINIGAMQIHNLIEQNKVSEKFDVVAWTEHYINETQKDINLISKIISSLKRPVSNNENHIKTLVDLVRENLIQHGVPQNLLDMLEDTVSKTNNNSELPVEYRKKNSLKKVFHISGTILTTKVDEIERVLALIISSSESIKKQKRAEMSRMISSHTILFRHFEKSRISTIGHWIDDSGEGPLSGEGITAANNTYLGAIAFNEEELVAHRNYHRNLFYGNYKSFEERLIEAVLLSKRKNNGSINYTEVAKAIGNSITPESVKYRYHQILLKGRVKKGSIDSRTKLDFLQMEHEIRENPQGYIGQTISLDGNLHGTINEIDSSKGIVLVTPNVGLDTPGTVKRGGIKSRESFGKIIWDSTTTLDALFNKQSEGSVIPNVVSNDKLLAKKLTEKVNLMYEQLLLAYPKIIDEIKGSLGIQVVDNIQKQFLTQADTFNIHEDVDSNIILEILLELQNHVSENSKIDVIKAIIVPKVKANILNKGRSNSVESVNFTSITKWNEGGEVNPVEFIADSKSTLEKIIDKMDGNSNIRTEFFRISRDVSTEYIPKSKNEEFSHITSIINNILKATELIELEQSDKLNIHNIVDVTKTIQNTNSEHDSIVSIKYIQTMLSSLEVMEESIVSAIENPKHSVSRKIKLKKELEYLKQQMNRVTRVFKNTHLRLSTDVTLSTYNSSFEAYKRLTGSSENPLIKLPDGRTIQDTGRELSPTQFGGLTHGRNKDGVHIRSDARGTEGFRIWKDINTHEEFILESPTIAIPINKAVQQLRHNKENILLTNPVSIKHSPQNLGVWRYKDTFLGQTYRGKNSLDLRGRVKEAQNLRDKILVSVDIEAESEYQNYSLLGQVGISAHDVANNTEVYHNQMTYQGWRPPNSTTTMSHSDLISKVGNADANNQLYFISNPSNTADSRKVAEIQMLLDTHKSLLEIEKKHGDKKVVYATFNDNADISKLAQMSRRHKDNLKTVLTQTRAEEVNTSLKIRKIQSNLRLIKNAEEYIKNPNLQESVFNIHTPPPSNRDILKFLGIKAREHLSNLKSTAYLDSTEVSRDLGERYAKLGVAITKNNLEEVERLLSYDTEYGIIPKNVKSFINIYVQERKIWESKTTVLKGSVSNHNPDNPYMGLSQEELETKKQNLALQIADLRSNSNSEEVRMLKKTVEDLSEASRKFDQIQAEKTLDIMAFEIMFHGHNVRGGQGAIYKELFGQDLVGAHTAKEDARAAIRVTLARVFGLGNARETYADLDVSQISEVGKDSELFTRIYTGRGSRNSRTLSNRVFTIKDILMGTDINGTPVFSFITKQVRYGNEIQTGTLDGSYEAASLFGNLSGIEGLTMPEAIARQNLKVKDLARRTVSRHIFPSYSSNTTTSQPDFLYITQRMETFQKYFENFSLDGKSNEQVVTKIKGRLVEIEHQLSGSPYNLNNELKQEKSFLLKLLDEETGPRLIHQYKEMNHWYKEHFVHADKKFFDIVGNLYTNGEIDRNQAEFIIRDRHKRLYEPLTIQEHREQLNRIQGLKNSGLHTQAAEEEARLSLRYNRVTLDTAFENSFITPQVPGFSNNYSINIGNQETVGADLNEFVSRTFLRSYGDGKRVDKDGAKVLAGIFTEPFGVSSAITKLKYDKGKQDSTVRRLLSANVLVGEGKNKVPIQTLLNNTFDHSFDYSDNLVEQMINAARDNQGILGLSGVRSAFGTDVLQPTYKPEHSSILENELLGLNTAKGFADRHNVLEQILLKGYKDEIQENSELRRNILNMILPPRIQEKLGIYTDKNHQLLPSEVNAKARGKYSLAYILQAHEDSVRRQGIDILKPLQIEEIKGFLGYTNYFENRNALLESTQKGSFGNITTVDAQGNKVELNAGDLSLHLSTMRNGKSTSYTLKELANMGEYEYQKTIEGAGPTFTKLHHALMNKYFYSNRPDDSLPQKDVALEMVKAAQEASLTNVVAPKIKFEGFLHNLGETFQQKAYNADKFAETVKLITGTTQGKMIGLGLAVAVSFGVGLRKEPSKEQSDFDSTGLEFIQPEGGLDYNSQEYTSSHVNYQVQAHITAKSNRKINKDSLINSLHTSIGSVFKGNTQKSHKINDDRRPINKNTTDRVLDKLL